MKCAWSTCARLSELRLRLRRHCVPRRVVLHWEHGTAGGVCDGRYVVPRIDRQPIGHALQRGVLRQCRGCTLIHRRDVRGAVHSCGGQLLPGGQHHRCGRDMPDGLFLHGWYRGRGCVLLCWCARARVVVVVAAVASSRATPIPAFLRASC